MTNSKALTGSKKSPRPGRGSKERLSALLLLLLMPLLAACQGSAFRLSACLGPEPESLDPGSGADDIYGLHLFEGLMKYEAGDLPAGADENVLAAGLAPGQAASYEVSEDGLTYTFHLREDICWSDGSPVTADDFVFAWRRLADPQEKLAGGELLRDVVAGAGAVLAGEAGTEALSVAAPDRHTFTVTLEQPVPWFPELTAQPALSPMPRAGLKQAGEQWATAEHIISNGAFRLDHWQEGEYISLVPNEYYYDRESLGPAELRFFFKDTETEIWRLFQAGRCHFIQSFPTQAAAEADPEEPVYSLPRPGACLIQFSCAALPDWRVRAALALAVDREGLAHDLLQGGQTPAGGLLEPRIAASEETGLRERGGQVLTAALAAAYPQAELSSYAGCRELAVRLLEEARNDGFAQASPLRLICGQGASAQATAQAIREDIHSALGLEIEVDQLDQAAFDQALQQGDFALARIAWVSRQTDPLFYLNMFAAAGEYNYAGWRSPGYDRLLEQAGTQTGPERDDLLTQAEQALFQPGGFPVLPLYFYGCQYAMDGVSQAAYAPWTGFLFHQAQALPAEDE